MTPALDAFYNTRSAEPGCFLALAADCLFISVRYLCGGRTISVVDQTRWCETKTGEICLVRGARISVTDRWEKPTNKAARWACNFFAALVFIPCVIAGTVLKLVAHCNILTAAPLQRRYRMAIRALAEQNVVEGSLLLQVSETPAYITTGPRSVFLAYRIMGVVKSENEKTNSKVIIMSENLDRARNYARRMEDPDEPVIFAVPDKEIKKAQDLCTQQSLKEPNFGSPRFSDRLRFLWA